MLSQGSYHYTLSSNGCLIRDTFQIGTGLHNAVSFQTSSTNVSCYGFDGTAQVSMINGQTQNYFDDFNSGSYNSNYGVPFPEDTLHLVVELTVGLMPYISIQVLLVMP